MSTKIRSFLAAIISLALISFGIPVAQASSTTSPTTVSANGNLEQIIPLDDTKSLLIWRDGSPGHPNQLVSSVLYADGTLEPMVIIQAPSDGGYIRLSSNNAWTRMPDGSIALTWITSNENGNDYETKVFAAITDDGTAWNAPVEVQSSVIDTSSIGMFDRYRSGHLNAQIASDGFSRLALQVDYSSGLANDWAHYLTTSTDGTNWFTTGQHWFTPQSSRIFDGTIIGLQNGGFIASWVADWGTPYLGRYVATLNGAITNTWQEPKALVRGAQLNYGAQLVQSSPTEVALAYVDELAPAVRYGLKVNRYSLVTKRWSSQQMLIESGPADYLDSTVHAAVGKDGKTTVSFVSTLNGTAKILANTFKGSQIDTQTTVLTAQSALYLAKLIANPSGSVSYVYYGGTPNVRIFTPDDQTGNVDSILGTGIAGEVQVAVTPSGTAFVAANVSNEAKFAVVDRNSVPLSFTPLTVTGKAKVNSTVRAAAMEFKSISGVGSTTYQWYACKTAVPANTVQRPVGCVAIAKAKASSFKVTSKQKGKFLTVSLSNTNAFGTSVVFAASATKAK